MVGYWLKWETFCSEWTLHEDNYNNHLMRLSIYRIIKEMAILNGRFYSSLFGCVHYTKAILISANLLLLLFQLLFLQLLHILNEIWMVMRPFPFGWCYNIRIKCLWKNSWHEIIIHPIKIQPSRNERRCENVIISMSRERDSIHLQWRRRTNYRPWPLNCSISTSFTVP